MIEVDGREFATLREVHDWAKRTLPAAVVAVASGTITGPGTSWTHPVPLTIRGGTWDGAGADGWWLSYRTPTPLTVEGVEVRRFRTGGIDAGDPDQSRGTITVHDSVFADLGGGPGYAAVFATDCDITVDGCEFRDLVQDPHGPLLHCCYLVRSRGIVRGCVARRCSGDAFRARDGSDLAVIGCEGHRAGVQALASTWREAGEADSLLHVRDCKPGKTYGGRPSLAAYRVR